MSTRPPARIKGANYLGMLQTILALRWAKRYENAIRIRTCEAQETGALHRGFGLEFWHEGRQLKTWIRFATAAANDMVLARINGTEITQGDVSSAGATMGAEMAGMTDQQRRRWTLEFLITNQLMADAALNAKFDQGQGFDRRMQNYRRAALAEIFYKKMVRDQVTEADARKAHNRYAAEFKQRNMIRARHMLVESEEQAHDIVKRLGRDDDFAGLANEFSKDTASEGGDLGFFGRAISSNPSRNPPLRSRATRYRNRCKPCTAGTSSKFWNKIPHPVPLATKKAALYPISSDKSWRR